jgi:hypothetical protein
MWKLNPKGARINESNICKAGQGNDESGHYFHLPYRIIWNHEDVLGFGRFNRWFDFSHFCDAAAVGCHTCSFFCEVLPRCTGQAVQELEGSITYTDFTDLDSTYLMLEYVPLDTRDSGPITIAFSPTMSRRRFLLFYIRILLPA